MDAVSEMNKLLCRVWGEACVLTYFRSIYDGLIGL